MRQPSSCLPSMAQVHGVHTGSPAWMCFTQRVHGLQASAASGRCAGTPPHLVRGWEGLGKPQACIDTEQQNIPPLPQTTASAFGTRIHVYSLLGLRRCTNTNSCASRAKHKPYCLLMVCKSQGCPLHLDLTMLYSWQTKDSTMQCSSATELSCCP